LGGPMSSSADEAVARSGSYDPPTLLPQPSQSAWQMGVTDGFWRYNDKALTRVFALVRASIRWRPRQDSNLRTRLRRPMLYPLSYEGVGRRA
jgi:hypothetical protein